MSDFNLKKANIVGIAGLGLIGGSFAKAFKENANIKVYATDLNEDVVAQAIKDGTVDGLLDEVTIKECDLIIPALYPKAINEYLKKMAPYIRKNALVIDTGGLKRVVCKECFPLAKEYGFTFVGGHPMAGKKYSGYEYSTGSLFNDASMILVPEDPEDKELIDAVTNILSPCNFGMITVCSAEKHDEMIAFTSEMAHIVSNAYIKSPTALAHKGFSAGSYKDMTRVAWLNETMWTEIFMENKDNLIKEIDYITSFLNEYKSALIENDSDYMWKLLHDGKVAKETVDGK